MLEILLEVKIPSQAQEKRRKGKRRRKKGWKKERKERMSMLVDGWMDVRAMKKHEPATEREELVELGLSGLGTDASNLEEDVSRAGEWEREVEKEGGLTWIA